MIMNQGILCVDIGTNFIKYCLVCKDKIIHTYKIPSYIIFRKTNEGITNKIILDSDESLLENYNPQTDTVAKDMLQLICLKYSKYMSDIYYTPLKVNKDEDDCLTITIANNGVFYPEEIAAKLIENIAINLSVIYNIEIHDLILSIDDWHDVTTATSLSANAGLNLLKHMENWRAITQVYLTAKQTENQEKTNVIIIDLGCDALKMYHVSLKGNAIISSESEKSMTWTSNEFTTHLYNHILQKNMYTKNYKQLNEEDKIIIENQCNIAKVVLCNQATYQCHWKEWNCELSRNDFDRCTSQTVKRMIAEIKIFLRRKNIDKKNISNLIVVGGSANIPEVKSKIEQFFGIEMFDLKVQPEYAVVNGLAKCFIQGNLT